MVRIGMDVVPVDFVFCHIKFILHFIQYLFHLVTLLSPCPDFHLILLVFCAEDIYKLRPLFLGKLCLQWVLVDTPSES